MGKVMILLDSDILIDVLRNQPGAAERLLVLSESESLAVGTVTQMELIVGCLNLRDLRRVERLLGGFEIRDLTIEISRRAVELLREYRLSHGLLLADALVAATALINGMPLLTRNQRDYRFIQGLELLPLTE
ncbi:type II toxin-antitoxin system VapC family toxin [Pseudanabaenaceae cyanobacterium LEGE 13415]|nr:type II toxin-antitoxin system VapC family toxin [Pseudanabaenaceae cyanobacterium LEGE 13415]